MTIAEKFYAMNAAVQTFLNAQGHGTQIYKYGRRPDAVKYPYFQSAYRVTSAQPFPTKESGRYTDFEYQLNFFTAAKNEDDNDAALFTVFEQVREAIGNPNYLILNPVAQVLKITDAPEFQYKGGLEVIQRGLIIACRSVCSNVLSDNTTTATIDNAVAVAAGDLRYE